MRLTSPSRADAGYEDHAFPKAHDLPAREHVRLRELQDKTTVQTV